MANNTDKPRKATNGDVKPELLRRTRRKPSPTLCRTKVARARTNRSREEDDEEHGNDNLDADADVKKEDFRRNTSRGPSRLMASSFSNG